MKKDLNNVKEYRDKNSSRIDKWVTTHLSAFILKNSDQKNHNEITHIIDFLNSPQAPKRITRLGYEDAKSLADKWLEFLSKNKEVNENETLELDIKLIKSYSDGFKWVQLDSEDSYKREGSKMGHCVATYYRKPSAIYSLRDEKNQPHCTVELVKRKNQVKMSISQIRGKQNKAPVLKYVGYIRDMFMKQVEGVWVEDKYHIEKYEMKNLYFYQNGKEYIDLCNLPKSIILYDVLEPYVLETLGQAILQCDNVVFKEHVEMPIELFSKRKNWTFEKTLTLLNSKYDEELELDLSGLKHIQIKNKIYYYGENVDKIKVKQKTVSLKNINAKLCQISGANFKILNDSNVDVLELDVAKIDFNNAKVNASLLSYWNNNVQIKNNTNIQALLVEHN